MCLGQWREEMKVTVWLSGDEGREVLVTQRWSEALARALPVDRQQHRNTPLGARVQNKSPPTVHTSTALIWASTLQSCNMVKIF